MQIEWAAVAVSCGHLLPETSGFPSHWRGLPVSALAREIAASESQNRAALDAALRMRMRSGQWPALTAEETFLLHERALFGVEFCQQAYDSDLPWTWPNDPEEVLERLLVAEWAQTGLLWFQCRLRLLTKNA